MKIVNLRKFIISILFLLGIIFILSLIISKATLSYKETSFKIISVSEGDTLWDIAKNNQQNNAYYKAKDIRYIIDDLAKINNLQIKNLVINQELKIPII